MNELQSPQNLFFHSDITRMQVECLINLLHRQNQSELVLVEKKINKIIISKMVAVCSLDMNNKNLYDFLAQNFIEAQLEQLKLRISSFEDQLLFIRDVVFKPGGENMQGMMDEEEKEKETSFSKKQEPVFDFQLTLSMHPTVQHFALKSFENLLYITNLQTFKSKGNQYTESAAHLTVLCRRCEFREPRHTLRVQDSLTRYGEAAGNGSEVVPTRFQEVV